MVTTASVMLAAGGSGGHLFPAFALAEELGRRGITVDLITDTRGDRYGTGFPAREVYQVPAATLSGASPLAAANTVLTLAKGVRAASKVLDAVKPAVVVGFGGYPSFPPLVAAGLKGIPSALHEQNAVLGRANRMLARRVTAIATSFETVKLLDGPNAGKAHLTGNPVRDAVVQWGGQAYQASRNGDVFRLLIFGGSQGARFFSDTVPPALLALPAELRRRLSVIQQARPEDLERVKAAYASGDDGPAISAEVAPFFPNLPELMAASHMVIARSGASTVAELCVLGRPSILVPLPHAVDNDQMHNAARLADAGGAIRLEQTELTVPVLTEWVERMMTSPDELVQGAEAARKLGRPDAVQRLADLVVSLMEKAATAAA